MHFTLELKTPITVLFVNENSKCGFAFFSQNVTNSLVPKLFWFAKNIVFAFSAPPFQWARHYI